MSKFNQKDLATLANAFNRFFLENTAYEFWDHAQHPTMQSPMVNQNTPVLTSFIPGFENSGYTPEFNGHTGLSITPMGIKTFEGFSRQRHGGAVVNATAPEKRFFIQARLKSMKRGFELISRNTIITLVRHDR